MKKILVVYTDGDVDKCPPVTTVCLALLSLGFEVDLVCRHADALDDVLIEKPFFNTIDLGHRGNTSLERIISDYKAHSKLNSLLHNNKEYDIVWTMSESSARDCGLELNHFKHIMQILELSASAPPLLGHNDLFPLKASCVIKLAQNCFRVVVPEYNRSFIQQAWWKLPRRPAVLPNKPLLDGSSDKKPNIYADEYTNMLSDKRKKLLYQGVFSSDRNLMGFIDAIQILGDEYALYLIGDKNNVYGAKISEKIISIQNVVPIGFIPSPQHLLFTQNAYIGLMPYQASFYGRQSPLNALYCAPNKIWEYSRFGLPMIGSDVPGLTSIFNQEGIGVTCNIDDSASIVDAVHLIESSYQTYSMHSSNYFNSIDVINIIENIISGK